MIDDIVDYIRTHSALLESIEKGHNCSFLDFFLRKCLEKYIYFTNKDLENVYSDLEKYFQINYPVGLYIKRNLTCAAGNIFSSQGKHLSGYEEQYIKLAVLFADKQAFSQKATAWFLIRNSVSEDRPKLHKRLYELLLDLVQDTRIRELYEKEGCTFLSE